MSSPIDVSVITVTYKSEDHIKNLLDSIADSAPNLKIEVIVIDNYLSDKSLSIAARHHLKPKTIESVENVGFAKAVNQGIKNSTGKYIFLINPDSVLVGKCLKKLYDFAEKTPSIGAVVPRLYYVDGQIQPSVFHLPTIINAIKSYFFGQRQYFGKYIPKGSSPTVEAAVMAAFLIPRETIEKIGLLDERFFLYYEDVEYCRRLKKNKLPIYYLPSAGVKHIHGASGNFKRHLDSPLAKSAKIYHGSFYSDILNLTLWVGQKYQKVLQRLRK